MNTFVQMQGDNLIIFHNGERITVSASANSDFDEIVEAINKGDYDRAVELSNPARAMATFYSQVDPSVELVIRGNSVELGGNRLSVALEDRLISMYTNRLPLQPIVNFLTRVENNPSATARAELYLFLEGNSLPLTQDGHFMAYKSVLVWDGENTVDDSDRPFVLGDYQSIATSRKNGRPTRVRVGDVIEMPRNEVDDDRNNTCSYGYHFASLDYAQNWHSWDALVLMKIDPADVVSIPSDHHNQKGRTCRYTVHSVYKSMYEDDVEEAYDGPVFNDIPGQTQIPLRMPADDGLGVKTREARYQVCLPQISNPDQNSVLEVHAVRADALRSMRRLQANGHKAFVWDTQDERRWRS